jgi:hypothetical protein
MQDLILTSAQLRVLRVFVVIFSNKPNKTGDGGIFKGFVSRTFDSRNRRMKMAEMQMD